MRCAYITAWEFVKQLDTKFCMHNWVLPLILHVGTGMSSDDDDLLKITFGSFGRVKSARRSLVPVRHMPGRATANTAALPTLGSPPTETEGMAAIQQALAVELWMEVGITVTQRPMALQLDNAAMVETHSLPGTNSPMLHQVSRKVACWELHV